MSKFQTTDNITTTEVPSTISPYISNDTKYLVVPVVVIILIMFLSLLVYLMARKRRLDTIRQNILSLYEFDSNEEEWDSIGSYDNPNYATFEYSTTSL